MPIKNMDAGYRYRAIGAFCVLLGFILGIIGLKGSINLIWPSILLIIVGVEFGTFGLTKIEVKDNKAYESYLHFVNKIDLMLFPICFLLVFVSVFVSYRNITLSIILLFVAFIISLWFRITFYATSYEAINNIMKMEQKERNKAVTLIIVTMILGVAAWFLINFIIL